MTDCTILEEREDKKIIYNYIHKYTIFGEKILKIYIYIKFIIYTLYKYYIINALYIYI